MRRIKRRGTKCDCTQQRSRDRPLCSFVISSTMNLLSVSLTLCALLTLSRGLPIANSSLAKHTGLCEFMNQHGPIATGAFVPRCDAHGNFLPQQCWLSTGYCWCVDVITGEEIPNTRTPPGTIPVDCSREFYCPYGWSRFGKRCFIFVDSPKSWIEAENYCLFEAANLASIQSDQESHFIQSLTRADGSDFPESWIGGHDAVYPCFWMWSDGSKFSYKKWHRDYDMKTTENCLKMNYGYDWKWNSAFCNETLPFVCSKKI